MRCPWRRGNLLVIGSVIAQNGEAAIDLARSLYSDWKGRVWIDVPNEQTSSMGRLSCSGFSEVVVSL
ncbi:GNAT family N-acetyltransferase [Alicyclobacillus cycloheptanicus]|uniref:hypothetical protein n=1 Tax=Alicyclobacillus cycloheptanicus TaxID=1457 RepID=UPI003908B7E8